MKTRKENLLDNYHIQCECLRMCKKLLEHYNGSKTDLANRLQINVTQLNKFMNENSSEPRDFPAHRISDLVNLYNEKFPKLEKN